MRRLRLHLPSYVLSPQRRPRHLGAVSDGAMGDLCILRSGVQLRSGLGTVAGGRITLSLASISHGTIDIVSLSFWGQGDPQNGQAIITRSGIYAATYML